jgi:hypothetical protein
MAFRPPDPKSAIGSGLSWRPVVSQGFSLIALRVEWLLLAAHLLHICYIQVARPHPL